MTHSTVLSFLILILLLCGILYYQRNLETEHLAMEPKVHSDSLSNAGSQSYTCVYVRHCTTDRILGKTPKGLQSVPFEVTGGSSPDNEDSRKSAFQEIFKNKVWIAPRERNNSKAASGHGSTLLYAQEVISALHSLISQLKQQLGVEYIRLLDIPCGDMVWMSRFLKTRDDVHYTGLDIVPELISRHRKDFVNHSNWTFRVQDIVHNSLNESYDLILCRMMLQHLFHHDVMMVLKHLSESGSRLLLTTSFNRVSANSELPGMNNRFRRLNLELPPFSLIPPVCIVRDGDPDDPYGQFHFLGLWQLPIRKVKACNSIASFRVPGFGVDFFSCTDWS